MRCINQAVHTARGQHTNTYEDAHTYTYMPNTSIHGTLLQVLVAVLREVSELKKERSAKIKSD